MLAVYGDDMIVPNDDVRGIAQLKQRLAKEIKIKDMVFLTYFLGIEVACGAEMMVLSQRKYELDLLTET